MSQTVSGLSIFFMLITLLLTLVFPIVLSIVLCVRKKISFIPLLVGAGVFFLFQLILRIPAIQIASAASPAFAAFTKTPLWGGIFLGLTAGIFEEFGRYIGYKVCLKKRTAWRDGLAFGIGHGGIEAIAIVGLGQINNLLYTFLINTGAFAPVAAMLPAETAKTLVDSLVNTPSYMFLLGGIERMFAMAIQIALSLLVLYAVRERKFRFVLLAVLLHLVLDAPLTFLMSTVGVWGTELFIMLCAGAAVVYIVFSKKQFEKDDAKRAAAAVEQPVITPEQ